jgi:16S rRNA (guanine966-N2)-methyltransferase
MRIVGGKFRGQVLAAPKGSEIRPTSEKVREAIFNILEHGTSHLPIEGARILDLFAGTGAFGFEALSRGARSCLFIDERAEARALIRRNADTLGVTGLSKIWRRDATRLGRNAPSQAFDFVFIDPPYGKGLGERSLFSLVDGQWLGLDTMIMLEESGKAHVSIPPELELADERVYGDTKVMILKHRSGDG